MSDIYRHRLKRRCYRENNGGVGAGGDGGVTGDFEGAHDLAEGLFTATASSEAFECGNTDGGQEAHDSDDSEKFNEGEGRLRAARMLQFLIFDFEFWIGGGDWLMRSQGKDAGGRRGEGSKGDHD